MYKVNQNNIDPLPLCQTPGQLQAILRRDEIKIPDQNAGEGEEEYCERLRQVSRQISNFHVSIVHLCFSLVHQRETSFGEKESAQLLGFLTNHCTCFLKYIFRVFVCCTIFKNVFIM